MAVKARAEITLSSIRDVQSVTRYYLLQSSTSAVPSKPTTNPPGGNWVTSEPTYTSGSTNSLYFVDLTVFSDDSFVYSDVSLSSSYEAAKVAYNKAESAESIAERATHSINLTPFGSRSFADTDYWVNGFANDGLIGTYGTVYNTEQLEDGWIHVLIDNTEQTGSATYVGDSVLVATCPAVKPGKLYTFLYEVRNNKSVLTGANTYFYIIQRDTKQFWGGAYEELIEGTGTNSTFNLAQMAPDQDIVYRKRFTKYADDGEHAGNNPNALFEIPFRTGKGDYADYEVRISLYEGRYLGDYMPYVVSDTTELNAAINAANALAQSAKDTADGKITTFYAASTAVPTATTVGDLWIKTDDGNSLWRWNGTSWVSVDNADIQSALTAAGTAQSTADSKIITFAQPSQPTATDVGDIWIDTDNNNKLYRWDGAEWVDVHDPKIAENSDRLDESNARIKELMSDGANLIIGTVYPDVSSNETLPRIFGQTYATRHNNSVASVAEHGIRVTNNSTGYTYIAFGESASSANPKGMNGLVAGETYTISADVTCKILSKNTNTTTYYLRFNYYDDHATTGTLALNKYKNVLSITKNDRGVEKSARCEFTFTIPENVTMCYIGFWCNRSTAAEYQAGDFIELRNLKLEKGSVATPWCAPIDWNAKIQQSADGKNTNTYTTKSSAGAITYPANAVAGDQLFVAEYGSTVYTTLYRFNGTSWENTQIGGMAVTQLDAGNIVAGTMSAARIKGGELSLGGENDTDGVMKVYDAEGNLVGSFTKEGLMAIAGTIAGWAIRPGEFYTEWSQSTSNYKARLSTRDGLNFEQTNSEEGFEQFLRQLSFSPQNLVFLHRGTDGYQTAGFLSGIDGLAPDDDVDGGISISPNLVVSSGNGAIYADKLYLKTDPDNTYTRQPQLIMKGSIVVKNGSTNKNVVLCTIPTAYQDGYYIIPFVSRTYGLATGVPDDAGDFKYAYYNHVNYTINLKLFNNLTSGVWYEFVYFIYALPKT